MTVSKWVSANSDIERMGALSTMDLETSAQVTVAFVELLGRGKSAEDAASKALFAVLGDNYPTHYNPDEAILNTLTKRIVQSSFRLVRKANAEGGWAVDTGRLVTRQDMVNAFSDVADAILDGEGEPELLAEVAAQEKQAGGFVV